MITIAALSPALDMTYVVDELVLGEPHRPSVVVRVAGGKALNSARAAARLGADVVAVPVLGGQIGSLVGSLLESDGIEAQVVPGDAETRICVSIASDSNGSLTEVYENPAPLTDIEWEKTLATLAKTVAAGDWLSFSGGLPPATGPGLVDLVRLGSSLGARLALDTHGSALRSVLDLGPGILGLLKINRSEAAAVLGVSPTVPLTSLVAQLRREAGCDVVVTDGTAGSVAADESGQWQVTLPASAGAIGRYPVGSGDCYLGALLASLTAGSSLPDAAALAAGAGSANAVEPGAGVFSASVARAFAARVEVDRLGNG